MAIGLSVWGKIKTWLAAAWSSVKRGVRGVKNWPRAAKLAGFLITLLIVFVAADGVLRWRLLRNILYGYAQNGPLLGPLFFYDTAKQAPSWRDRAATFGVLISAVVGYMVWHWRDVNARATIDNARKDVNLKEFQEIQLRAAGALDKDKLSEESRRQLQIAALHQLRGFLSGEYGAAFQRPAFELLLAGHTAAMARICGPAAIREWAESDNRGDPSSFDKEIEKAIDQSRAALSAVDKERLGILRDEAEALLATGFPLNGRHLDLVDWSKRDLRRRHLFRARLIGADLEHANLEGAILIGAHLEGADLWFAHLEGADLRLAHLEGADLSSAHLKGADLQRAYLEGANLRSAHLEGAKLWGWNIEGADLEDASFDDATELAEDWHKLSPEERKPHQDALRERGARHVRDPEGEED